MEHDLDPGAEPSGAPSDDTDPGQVDIDAPPPVPDDEPDDDAPGEATLQEMESRLEERFQRRFDKAISKIQRSLVQQASAATGGGQDDDDQDDETAPPVRRSVRPRSSRVDVTSIRSLARDRVNDEMEAAGTPERRAVKSVIDKVLPAVNWSEVDQEEFVDDLVSTLVGTAQDLVKTGSDRKLAQLRSLGLVPERTGQPQSSSRNGKASPVEQMQRGAARAQSRFPDGTRRVGR